MRGSDERTGELFNCLSYARIMLLFVEGGAFLGRPNQEPPAKLVV